MDNYKEIMTIDQVADYLQLGKMSIRKLVKSGKIPCKKVLNKYRFVREDIKEWVSSK